MKFSHGIVEYDWFHMALRIAPNPHFKIAEPNESVSCTDWDITLEIKYPFEDLEPVQISGISRNIGEKIISLPMWADIRFFVQVYHNFVCAMGKKDETRRIILELIEYYRVFKERSRRWKIMMN